MRLVIDPGHGGEHPGAVLKKEGGELREADATLATALTLKHVLATEMGFPGEIRLTRTEDVSIPFSARVAGPADLLISLHYDIPRGAAPIYYQKGRCDSYYVARRIRVLAAPDKPLWSTEMARWTRLFIDDAQHPAILYEVDTLDNYRDDREYRLEKMRPLARALVEVMRDIQLGF